MTPINQYSLIFPPISYSITISTIPIVWISTLFATYSYELIHGYPITTNISIMIPIVSIIINLINPNTPWFLMLTIIVSTIVIISTYNYPLISMKSSPIVSKSPIPMLILASSTIPIDSHSHSSYSTIVILMI